MFYKTPNELMINLDLVTSFEKVINDGSYMIIFYYIYHSNQSIVVFNKESSLKAEYDKIIRALKANKENVII